MAFGKIAAIGVSFILVVGVVIGVVISVGHFGVHKDGNSSGASGGADGHISSGMKSVDTICAPTQHKEACIKTLTPVANNGSTDPKSLVKASINAVLGEVRKAVDKSAALLNDDNIVKNNKTLKAAVEDCKMYLEFAFEDLENSIDMIGENDLQIMNDLTPELQNWLSSVLSHKGDCLDGLKDNPELVKAMLETGLANADDFAANALGIVTEISEILKTFNIPIDLNVTSNARRLLEADDEADNTTTEHSSLPEHGDVEGNQDFPIWFSAADRKLMAVQHSGGLRPNVVVAKDGSGKFKTITEAINAIPKVDKKAAKKSKIPPQRYVIYVKAGIYNEWIQIQRGQDNIYMYGDGPTKTIITGNKNTALQGFKTDRSATFAVMGSDFIARSIGFQNTAGPEGEQAVALRVQSDRSAFFNCRIDGYQDTLYIQTYRQFYRNCIISGTVDYIFGDSTCIIQDSMIITRKPRDGQKNTVTAHGRNNPASTTGLVFQNCEFVPERALFPLRMKIESYLGRPWRDYSRTVVMESNIGDFLRPLGWLPWEGTKGLNTLYYAEYANRGPGANTAGRVKWGGFHVIRNPKEAFQFTAKPFLNGHWLKATGVPFKFGFSH